MSKLAEIKFSGGVNLFADPTQIRPDQLAWSENLMPTRGGQVLATRPAMRWVRDVTNPSATAFRPVRAMFSPISEELALVFYSPVTDRLIFGPAGGRAFSPQQVNITPRGVSNMPVSMVQRWGETYVFTGFTPGHRIRVDPGASGYAVEQLVFSGAGNSNFFPQGAAVIRDRMMYWRDRSVTFSDRNDPLALYDNVEAKLIDIANDTFGAITHAQELNTTASGSPVQSVVAVWTADAMYMVLGEPAESFDTGSPIGSLQINKLTIAAGCVSGATVCQTPYGAIWAGTDDVWFLPFGSLPIRIGTNIRPALLNTPPLLRYRWHACYENGIYRLALDAPGAGPSDTSGCTHHWILDMRLGPPESADAAIWWGPHSYSQSGTDGDARKGTFAFVTSAGTDGTGETFSVQPIRINTDDGVNDRIVLCTLNGEGLRDEAAPNYPVNPPQALTTYQVGDIIIPQDEHLTGSPSAVRDYVWICTAAGTAGVAPAPVFNDGVTTVQTWDGATFTILDTSGGNPMSSYISTGHQQGTEIIPRLLTREDLGSAPRLEKGLLGVNLAHWVSNRGLVLYRGMPDTDESERILKPLGDDTSTTRLNTTRGQRVWNSRLLTPQTGRRFHSRSLQFYLTHQTGFVIDESNDTITWGLDNSVWFTTTIERRTYTSLIDLASKIVNKMNSDAGIGTFLEYSLGALFSLRSVNPSHVWFIGFDVTAIGGTGWTQENCLKCARLFSLLGVNTNAQDWYAPSPTFRFTNGPIPNADFWAGHSSPQTYGNAFAIEIAEMSILYDIFRREPT